jgi:hypothetical protein
VKTRFFEKIKKIRLQEEKGKYLRKQRDLKSLGI